MSGILFPTFPGMSLDVNRLGPEYEVDIDTSRSGKETRTNLWAIPRYRWDLTINFLRANTAMVTVYSTGGSAQFTGTETQALHWLLNELQGEYDFLWFIDPLIAQPSYYQVGGSPIGAPTPGLCTLASGTLANGTYYYAVTSMTATGESIQSVEVTLTISSGPAGVNVNWTPVTGAIGYNVYGRSNLGAEQLIAYVPGQSSSTYHDTGALTPSLPMPMVKVRFDMDKLELAQLSNFRGVWSAKQLKLVTIK